MAKNEWHLNISDTALRRIKKYCKKIKDKTEKEKKIQSIF